MKVPKFTTDTVAKFQQYIYRFYDQAGRSELPWRQYFSPYHVLVSEVMLQQTQVDRVIPKFTAFLHQFPDFETLAQATPAQVISQWQGLGYNRRGLNLQRAAQAVVRDFDGTLPTTRDYLLELPGIGPYTAAAIQAFAFNQPSLVIETNIRTVFLFHFFHGAYNVEDAQLAPLIDQTLDRENPRKWYSALMDYGTYLKKNLPNPSRQSKHHVRQSAFHGSHRQIRGAVLRALTQFSTLTITDLHHHLTSQLSASQLSQLSQVLAELQTEGFLKKTDTHWSLQ